MKILNLLICCSCFMYSCTDETGSDKPGSNQMHVSLPLASKEEMSRYPQISSEEKIENLVHAIASKNCVYSRAVGITGEYTHVFASFERLNKIATDAELFDLLKHDPQQ